MLILIIGTSAVGKTATTRRYAEKQEVSREWLSQYKKIALVASPEKVFQRRHGELNLSLEDA